MSPVKTKVLPSSNTLVVLFMVFQKVSGHILANLGSTFSRSEKGRLCCIGYGVLVSSASWVSIPERGSSTTGGTFVGMLPVLVGSVGVGLGVEGFSLNEVSLRMQIWVRVSLRYISRRIEYPKEQDEQNNANNSNRLLPCWQRSSVVHFSTWEWKTPSGRVVASQPRSSILGVIHSTLALMRETSVYLTSVTAFQRLWKPRQQTWRGQFLEKAT